MSQTMLRELQIKICGIKTHDTLTICADAGADMVGFMHFEKSPRHVELEQIRDLISRTKNLALGAKIPTKPIQSVVVLVAINQCAFHITQGRAQAKSTIGLSSNT